MKPNPLTITYSDQQAADVSGLTVEQLNDLRQQNTGPDSERSPFNSEVRYRPEALERWLKVRAA